MSGRRPCKGWRESVREHRTYGTLDDPPIEDGDAGFVGVDERDASQINPGFVNEAVNYVFREMTAVPRKGNVPLPWLNGSAAGFPWDFDGDGLSFEYPRPIVGSVLAGGDFNDANDRRWTIVAGNPPDGGPTQVWRLREGYKAKQLHLPADFPRLTECSFTQAFNKLLLFCGRKYDVLEMEDVRTGFVVPSQTDSESDSGYNPVTPNTMMAPRSASGLFLGNRVFVPHGRDLVFASDFLNYTRGDIRADFRINQGSADELVALYKMGETSFVAFKEQSIYLVSNVYGDLSQLRLEELTREYGLVGRRAVVGTGSDVWFLSQRGVTSIGQALENKSRVERELWSDPLPKSWRRINWNVIAGAAAAYHEGRIYFAVPLDDAELESGGTTYSGVNNAVLVYDTATKAWAGLHTGGNMMVKEWLKFTWQGKTWLGYVSGDGMVYAYGCTFDDQIRPVGAVGSIAPIATRLVSRGYKGRPNQYGTHTALMKRWRSAAVVLNTWNPAVTLKSVTDGAAEEKTLIEDETRDRRLYYKPHDRPRFKIENDRDEHGDAWRQDYSVDMDRTGAGPSAAQNGQILLGSGVNYEQHQEAPWVRRVNAQGRYVQVVIENNQGRAEVKGIEINGVTGRARQGMAA
jgi:hypothetical protein